MLLKVSILAAAASLGAAACGTTAEPSAAPIAETNCAAPQTAQPTAGLFETRTESQCGPTLDFSPINSYQGEITTVQAREDAVVLVNGDCTGTLVAAQAGPIVLTAGHCVGLGDRPLLAFNVEANPDGDQLATNGTVIEQSSKPDYALIRLDKLPAIAPSLLTSRSSDLLAIIQHPRGGPKVIAEGNIAGICNGMIFYTNLDTLVGSSGAGVLNRQGYLLGVHTDGDCAADGSGSNYGWTAASIVQASSYLQDTDIGDR